MQDQSFPQMTVKQTFFLGVVSGFFVLCTIGFFILLGVFLKGGFPAGSALAKANNTAPTAAAAAPAVGQAATGEVKAVDVKRDHIRGNQNAKISVIEFSDLECFYCDKFHEPLKALMETYKNDVRWVYRHFPLTSIHANAQGAALASECAAEQGKFWEFADSTFAKQEAGLSAAVFKTIATELGLNAKQYDDCVASQKYAARVAEDSKDAQTSGGRGTPHTIIVGPNGEKTVVSGAQPDAVEAAIKQYLQ